MSHRADLSDSRLLDDTLPEVWAPLCALLGELSRLCAEAEATPGERRAQESRGAALRERLLLAAGPIIAAEGAELPLALDAHSRALLFADSVLLWTWFGEAGGRIRVDTLGSTTLPYFPVDFVPGEGDIALVKRALCRATGLDAEVLAEREARLRRLIANLEIKLAVTEALAERVRAASQAGQDGALGLFRELYGDLPFRPGEVALVCTTSVVFFCIPMPSGDDDGGGSAPDALAGRPAPEAALIRAFFAKVREAATSVKNIRFPAFGLFDIDAVSPALLDHIEQAVRARLGQGRVASEVVRQTLSTMVLVIPAGEAEKFLVHDVWGHGWQETLCEFEWLFADFASLKTPLAPTTGDRVTASGKTLRDAFVAVPEPEQGASGSGARVTLDKDILREVIDADLRARIKIGLNLAASECLADLIEHKFVRSVGDRHKLPTSSILPAATLKLDLSLSDLTRAVKLWRKPYVALVEEPEERERLMAALLAAGVPEPGLREALAAAAELIAVQVASAIDVEVGRSTAASERVSANLIERTLLGMVTLDYELSRVISAGEERYRALCAQGAEVPRWRCPGACIDLLAVALGWFYEQDHALNVWHMDEYLRLELWPRLIELEAAILAEAGGGPRQGLHMQA